MESEPAVKIELDRRGTWALDLRFYSGKSNDGEKGPLFQSLAQCSAEIMTGVPRDFFPSGWSHPLALALRCFGQQIVTARSFTDLEILP